MAIFVSISKYFLKKWLYYIYFLGNVYIYIYIDLKYIFPLTICRFLIALVNNWHYYLNLCQFKHDKNGISSMFNFFSQVVLIIFHIYWLAIWISLFKIFPILLLELSSLLIFRGFYFVFHLMQTNFHITTSQTDLAKQKAQY